MAKHLGIFDHERMKFQTVIDKSETKGEETRKLQIGKVDASGWFELFTTSDKSILKYRVEKEFDIFGIPEVVETP